MDKETEDLFEKHQQAILDAVEELEKLSSCEIKAIEFVDRDDTKMIIHAEQIGHGVFDELIEDEDAIDETIDDRATRH